MSFQSDIADAIIESAKKYYVNFTGVGYFDTNEPLKHDEIHSFLMVSLENMVPSDTALENKDILDCSNMLVEYWKSKAISRGIESTQLSQSVAETFEIESAKDQLIKELKSEIAHMEKRFNDFTMIPEGYVYLMKR